MKLYIDTAANDFRCSKCNRDILKYDDYMLDSDDFVPTYCLWCGTDKIKASIANILPLSAIKKALRQHRDQIRKLIDNVVEDITNTNQGGHGGIN